MSDDKSLTSEEIRALSITAVNQLIADVEAKRLLDNKELAETVAVCIRHSGQFQLRTLKRLLDQHKLEGIPEVGDQPRWQH